MPDALSSWLTCYIGNIEARAWIVRNLLEKDGLFKLSKEEIDTICTLSEGSSNLAKLRTKLLPSLCYIGLYAKYPPLIFSMISCWKICIIRIFGFRHEKPCERRFNGPFKGGSETRHRYYIA